MKTQDIACQMRVRSGSLCDNEMIIMNSGGSTLKAGKASDAQERYRATYVRAWRKGEVFRRQRGLGHDVNPTATWARRAGLKSIRSGSRWTRGSATAARRMKTVRRRLAWIAGPAVHVRVRWCVGFGLGWVCPRAGPACG